MTIANYQRMGIVNEPLRVTLRLNSGRPTFARVWLNDNQTEATLHAPSGVQFQTLDLFPMPRQSGTWRLNALAQDTCGNSNQTGLIRLVTVLP